MQATLSCGISFQTTNGKDNVLPLLRWMNGTAKEEKGYKLHSNLDRPCWPTVPKPWHSFWELACMFRSQARLLSSPEHLCYTLPGDTYWIISLLYVRYILQSDTAIIAIKMGGVVLNKVIGDWIISNQSEYQSQWHVFKMPPYPWLWPNPYIFK